MSIFLLASGNIFAQNSVQIGSEIVVELPTEVRIPVELSSDVDLSLLGIVIRFDPRFVQTSGDLIMTNNDRFSEGGTDKITLSIDNSAGEIVWTISDFSGGGVIPSGSGEIFSVEFIVSDSLLGNSAFLGVEILEAADSALNPVLVNSVDGNISAPPDKLSLGPIDVTTTPGIIATSADLTVNKDLSFLSFEITYDATLLQVDEGGILPQSERFSERVDITTSIDNEVGRLAITISDNETDTDLELLGGPAIFTGAGAIFNLQFIVNDEVDCISTGLELKNVTAFDPVLNPVKLGIQDTVFSLDHPSKGCVSFSRKAYSCISEVNEIVEIELRDMDLAAEVLLEFTFEEEDPATNTGSLATQYNLSFSSNDVIANDGYRSSHSLFFDDPGDFAIVEESFVFPGEAGRLELWYKPSNEEVLRDNFFVLDQT